jgi:hypothetical protein
VPPRGRSASYFVEEKLGGFFFQFYLFGFGKLKASLLLVLFVNI